MYLTAVDLRGAETVPTQTPKTGGEAGRRPLGGLGPP